MAYRDPEKRRIYNRRYYKIWNKKNRDRVLSYYRKYHRSPKGIAKRKALEATPVYREKARHKKWRLRFRITPEQYAAMLVLQRGVCAICYEKEKTKDVNGKRRHLCVDHNHATGAKRGLLCMTCNTLLGYVKDDPRVLREAIKYLKKHET